MTKPVNDFDEFLQALYDAVKAEEINIQSFEVYREPSGSPTIASTMMCNMWFDYTQPPTKIFAVIADLKQRARADMARTEAERSTDEAPE